MSESYERAEREHAHHEEALRDAVDVLLELCAEQHAGGRSLDRGATHAEWREAVARRLGIERGSFDRLRVELLNRGAVTETSTISGYLPVREPPVGAQHVKLRGSSGWDIKDVLALPPDTTPPIVRRALGDVPPWARAERSAEECAEQVRDHAAWEHRWRGWRTRDLSPAAFGASPQAGRARALRPLPLFDPCPYCGRHCYAPDPRTSAGWASTCAASRARREAFARIGSASPHDNMRERNV